MDYTYITVMAVPVILGLAIGYFIIKRRLTPKTFINHYRDGAPVMLDAPVNIEVQLTKEEYINVNKQLTVKTNWFTQRWWWLYIAVFVVLANTFSMNLSGLKDFDFVGLLKDYAPGLVLVLITFAVIRFYIKKQSSKVFDSTEVLKSHCSYIFNAAGYDIISDNVTHKATWQTVQGYMLLPDHVVVFTAPLQAFILPKRAFTPADLERFTTFLASNFELRKSLT